MESGSESPRCGECSGSRYGTECQFCDGFLNEIKKGACPNCRCSGFSNQCIYNDEEDTVACVKCAGNREGDRCELCKNGFHFANANPLEECIPCKCSESGTLNSSCDASGHCQCKAGYSGEKCEAKVQTFASEGDNPAQDSRAEGVCPDYAYDCPAALILTDSCGHISIKARSEIRSSSLSMLFEWRLTILTFDSQIFCTKSKSVLSSSTVLHRPAFTHLFNWRWAIYKSSKAWVDLWPWQISRLEVLFQDTRLAIYLFNCVFCIGIFLSIENLFDILQAGERRMISSTATCSRRVRIQLTIPSETSGLFLEFGWSDSRHADESRCSSVTPEVWGFFHNTLFE